MGDPAGIGAEVTVKAVSLYQAKGTRLVVLGDAEIMRRAAKAQGIDVPFDTVGTEDYFKSGPAKAFLDCNVLGKEPLAFGEESARSGLASMRYLEAAVSFLRSGKAQGLVTAPISKAAVNQAGYPIPGHTEWLAAQTGTKSVMMLVGGGLRVALVTTHTALANVPRLLSKELIQKTTLAVNKALREWFGIAAPRLAVLAFNPHAGEKGLFGREEEVIAAAVEEMRGERLNVTGPLPADTAFYRSAKGEFDAQICMYHDQGLIPLKLLAFETGVNVTLGLPFPRTSPDHGTAFDIAGKGKADHRSMLEALNLCRDILLPKENA